MERGNILCRHTTHENVDQTFVTFSFPKYKISNIKKLQKHTCPFYV